MKKREWDISPSSLRLFERMCSCLTTGTECGIALEYRAKWTFNGTGTVGGPNTWPWTGTGAYTNGDASWTAIGAANEESYSGQVGNQAAFNTLAFATPS